MRLYQVKPYVAIIISIFIFALCPRQVFDALRDRSISMLSPLWGLVQKSSLGVPQGISPFEIYKKLQQVKKEKLDLERDNLLLSSQLKEMQNILFSKQLIENDFEYLKAVKDFSLEEDFFQRRYEELKTRLALQLESVNARVIYREPSSWSSFFWIDKGSEYNKYCGVEIIAKNSPVVVGHNIVGIVEYVGAYQSKVRLITDEKLIISVRALRGYTQNKLLYDNLSLSCHQLKFRKDLFFSKEEQENTLKILEDLTQNIELLSSDNYMAKGEIQGSSLPLWRNRSQVLKGVGFNYDFSDEEGLSLDLRTGKILRQDRDEEAKTLIKEGDLLATTGLDGLFPPGFQVGIVTHIYPLEEGGFYYNLEAKSTLPHLNDIERVSVLAPWRDAHQ